MSGRQPRWLLLLSRIFIGFPAWPILSLWTFFVSSKDCIFRQIADLSKWSWNICWILRHQRVTALSGANIYMSCTHQIMFPPPAGPLTHHAAQRWWSVGDFPLWPNKIITTDFRKFFKGWGKGKHLIVSNLLCFEACELVWRHLQFMRARLNGFPPPGFVI